MNNKIIRFIDSQYNTLFTIPDGENIEVTFADGSRTIRKCTYIDDYHTKIGHNVFHICEFAEKMEQQGAKYIPVPSEKERNEVYILNHYGEFQKDKFYVSPESQTVTMVYYNPDSEAGGQLIYNSMSYENIKNAARFKDEKKFFDYLGSCCKQTLVDIDTSEFKDCAYIFINKTCDYVESNINTMKALLKLSAMEKARTAKYKEMER